MHGTCKRFTPCRVRELIKLFPYIFGAVWICGFAFRDFTVSVQGLAIIEMNCEVDLLSFMKRRGKRRVFTDLDTRRKFHNRFVLKRIRAEDIEVGAAVPDDAGD